ncbi:hypothetical protein LCGC14_2444400 [marine sediment metagenome]|uniref:Uncharacterized protein n=1 Tax=marine sediment metagenome TaxID=412755 RepID=A0A0F9C5G2_9ZZZZ
MELWLVCGGDMKSLDIIDKEGFFDIYKFHDHVLNCKVCLDFLESFVAYRTSLKELRNAAKAKTKKVPVKRNRSKTLLRN